VVDLGIFLVPSPLVLGLRLSLTAQPLPKIGVSLPIQNALQQLTQTDDDSFCVLAERRGKKASSKREDANLRQ
jgi:hypothetical protein